MPLKDGLQACQKCGGGGCYWCGKQGYVVQCYLCGTSDPGTVQRDEDDFTCLLCGAQFDKKGKPLDQAPEKKVTKPA